jgi:predicted acylesterase/phospholipase RssA
MRDYLVEFFEGKKIERSVIVQSVDLATGEVLIFDETTPYDKWALAVLASGSMPAFF